MKRGEELEESYNGQIVRGGKRAKYGRSVAQSGKRSGEVTIQRERKRTSIYAWPIHVQGVQARPRETHATLDEREMCSAEYVLHLDARSVQLLQSIASLLRP